MSLGFDLLGAFFLTVNGFLQCHSLGIVVIQTLLQSLALHHKASKQNQCDHSNACHAKVIVSDEYVEEAAREKLGLVKDNEIVFQEEN